MIWTLPTFVRLAVRESASGRWGPEATMVPRSVSVTSSPRCGTVSKSTLAGVEAAQALAQALQIGQRRVLIQRQRLLERAQQLGHGQRLEQQVDLGRRAEHRAEELLLALDAAEVGVGQAVALADEGDRLIAGELLLAVVAVEAAVAVVDVGDAAPSSVVVALAGAGLMQTWTPFRTWLIFLKPSRSTET